MNTQPSIVFEKVSKRYYIGKRHVFAQQLLPEFIQRRLAQRSTVDELWALQDVSLEVHPGEALGLIGSNGSGKTTTLSILAGITAVTHGSVAVSGRVGALIQLGAGFHPELTGRENIYLNASILGLKRAEVDRIYDEIVEFAELEKFMDTPVKRYSSGMYARLGFSVAIHIKPDILLVDEVLSVGDMNFQSKCQQRMRKMMSDRIAVVFVSHNLPSVQGLCDRVVWLDRGKIRASGKTSDVVAQYMDAMNDRALSTRNSDYFGTRWGSGDVTLTKVDLIDQNNQITKKLNYRDTATVRIEYQINKSLPGVIFRLWIQDVTTGVIVTSADSIRGEKIGDFGKRGVVEFIFPNLPLRPRNYSLSVVAVSTDLLIPYDRWGSVITFTVSSSNIERESGYVHGQQDLVEIPYQVRTYRCD
ncbi:MAG TPA: ABC transporter ATP-binding protein [Anaerolineales bacterium]|nr:ABC transporter ATP-binding protein [Anaerolineales bacterium]